MGVDDNLDNVFYQYLIKVLRHYYSGLVRDRNFQYPKKEHNTEYLKKIYNNFLHYFINSTQPNKRLCQRVYNSSVTTRFLCNFDDMDNLVEKARKIKDKIFRYKNEDWH